MGAFAVFFFTLFFLAIGFLLLWNGNSLQGHCCSTTDDSGNCSSKTSKTQCVEDCKWQYWNCDGPFPGQSKYNGPGKADCEDPDSNSQDQQSKDCIDNLKYKYHTCTYNMFSDPDQKNISQPNITTYYFCWTNTNEEDCNALTPVKVGKKQIYNLSNSTSATVSCPLHAEFPGCRWDRNQDHCVVNYPPLP